MMGYWKRDEETREVLKDGWLYTGDIGMFDEEGFLYIVDRKKDVIISGARNIYAREVEKTIEQHPAVQEVAVIGVPDAYWGEAVKALIVLKPGMRATESEIIDFCKQRLASYKKPRSVEFVDSLPKNPGGKVLKRQLRERYWVGMKRRVS
jgi:acyl-CoA synthetase (AMP-forming)/AMP-acid ligase II